ncbi:serine/threonine protein kinase [Pelatocladus sp. BLCC-F211]|uniref:serine/threonine protein kinase n=1 Tax=Pelatocladus sp. BLCC-F211 TaxID=3342752 RepID=UPI0035BAFD6B
MEILHQAGEIINQRYRILRKLGQGGVGITYAAVDLQSGEQVALKVLSLRHMSDWKKMELFEREAKILSQLNHPAIPRYLDYFQADTNSDHSFYIAQQLAPGTSLAMLVENGWRPHEGEVRQIAAQILEILIYLHSLTPPVIHRDIKPQNIILSFDSPQGNKEIDCSSHNNREAGKRLFLVDFGAVTDTYHNTVTGGSTVVGTFGYMAPEQFHSKAFPSTDLYGLGTTILFLLTGKSPADLPQRQLKINFRRHVKVSKDFANWLERMLEPVNIDRFSSAEVALATLLGQTVLRPQLPKKSNLISSGTENNLIVKIPPGYLYNNYSFIFLFCSIVFFGVFGLISWVILLDFFGWTGLLYLMIAFVSLAYTFFALASMLNESEISFYFPTTGYCCEILIWLCQLPFKLLFQLLLLLLQLLLLLLKLLLLLLKLLFQLLFLLLVYNPLFTFITLFINSVSTTRLQINQDDISLEKRLLNWCIGKIKFPKSGIIRVELENIIGYHFSHILICYKPFQQEQINPEEKRYFEFGSFLTQQEKEWLMWEIQNR